MNDKDTLKIGIIGCGVIAPAHVESFLNIPGVELAGLCDLVEDKCHRLAERFSIKPLISGDYREILSIKGLDAVSVCTDHASHAEICCEALRKGLAVLCEKPIASDNRGLDRILDTLRENPGSIFSGVFQNRFNPVFKAVKELVGREAFGRIVTSGIICNCIRTNEYYSADPWRGKWATEGGSVMINQAIHYLDLLLWFCGPPTSVSAKFANLTHQGVIETEDCVAASIEFESGALGTASATCSSFNGWQNAIWISGTDGFVFLNNGKPIEVSFKNPDMTELFDNLRSQRDGSGIVVGKAHYGNLHFAQIADFVKCIGSRSEPFVNASSSAGTVRTVMAIYESQRRGGANIDWPPLVQ